MKQIAIFDVCGTLYNSNTTYDFFDFFLKRNSKRRYLRYRIMKSFILKPLWKLSSLMEEGRTINRTLFLSLLEGFNVEKVQEEAAEFVSVFLFDKKQEELHQKLASHLTQNHHVVLLSASIEPVIEAIAKNLKVNAFFATRLGVHDGRYNGKLDFDMEGKKNSIFDQHYGTITARNVYFYSDNKEDINLLSTVNEPVVVCFKSVYETYWKIKMINPAVKYIFKI